jgi:hypothetical protein
VQFEKLLDVTIPPAEPAVTDMVDDVQCTGLVTWPTPVKFPIGNAAITQGH